MLSYIRKPITHGLAVLALGLLAVSLTACDSDSNADDGPELDIVATALDGGFNTLVAAVQINVDGATVRINDATVTTIDIETTNGIIHVIDTVLLPPTE